MSGNANKSAKRQGRSSALRTGKNNALRRRVWRIIGENKGRYIGIFILIFLGSFAFVIMAGVGDNLANLVGGFEVNNRQEDLNFASDRLIANIAALEAKAGAAIEPYLAYDIKLPEGELRLLSPTSKVNNAAVVSGSPLKNPGDILLDPNFCTAHGLKAGGQIDLGGKTFNIAGTFAVPNYIYILKNVHDVMPPAGFGIGMISHSDFEAFPNARTVYAVYFNDRENINAQTAGLYRTLVEEGYSLSEWIDSMNNNRTQMPWASITGAQTMTYPVAVVMFLLCCIIVSVMIRRMVKSDGTVIGTLYAQGYRRRELTRHYMALPLLLSFFGGLAGVLLALPCIAPTVTAMVIYYNVPITGMLYSAANTLLGVLLPMVFLGAASWLSVRKTLKKTAGELMKGDEQKAKVNFLERGLRLERFKFNTKFRLREQMRSIPRLLFLLLGVTGASVLLLFGFTINNSMNVVLGTGESDMYLFNYEYSFKEVRQGGVPEGTDPFNAIRCYPAGMENAEFYVMAIAPDGTGIEMRDFKGNALSKNRVNMTYPMAQRLKLKEGDSITFISKLDGRDYTLAIDGIIDTYTGQMIFMPLDDFNAMTGQPAGSYTGILSNRILDIDEIELAGFKDMAQLGSMSEFASVMTATVATIAVIASLIGAIIIFLVTSLIIEENRNTISLLKVFGYKKKEAAKLILNSSSIVVIIGFWLGLPLMLVSANTLYGYLGEMINLVMPMIVAPWTVLLSFAIIFAVYLLTRQMCGRKLAGIPMSEALKAGTE